MLLLKLHVLFVFVVVACTVQAALVDLEVNAVYDAQSSCVAMSNTPVQVTAVPAVLPCSASTACVETPAGSSLFPATVCSVTDGTANGDFIETTLLYLFGSSPYVVVERYNPGQSCDSAGLKEIAAFLADGLCHKTGWKSSYTATRAADGSVMIATYETKLDCIGAITSTLDVTAAQALGQSCAADGTGVADTKIYGTGVTPLYLKASVSFDTTDGSCSPPMVQPTREVMSLTSSTGCTATSFCMGSAAPFSRIACSLFSTYQTDVAAAFGSVPYVIVVESYSPGRSCAGTRLASVTVYRADGKCHRTGPASSYSGMRSSNDSDV
ncbi:hypothetical protein PC110_g14105 [Phytophthora cactorum]|uniref:Uncharacterized protein n=2 Tax=Phytophthora cactorum TaxID=29920 RepID=A0A329RYV7_9STRA|nr:hypothetical protein PC110_g14105 [Phytophthora cactorum]